MKVLFTIPHYFRPTGAAPDGRSHGSVRDAAPRVAALTECLTAIHRALTPRASVLSHSDRQAHFLTPQDPIRSDVVVCTVGGDHLLDLLGPVDRRWTHHPTTASPPFLGYECHAVLRDRLGEYDYYCYLEDDIVLTDPWLFRKLRWFSQQFGEDRLLQPNRFEAGTHPLLDKIYVDGDLPPHCTASFQHVQPPTTLSADVFGVPIEFQSTTNPHAGCFFLNAAQMERWSRTSYFLDRSDAFIGALESAASLGIMRAFSVFKPSLVNADFFEVRHHGSAYLSMVKPGR
ncbi:MAG TPA: hypothetical protein VGJ05_08525 [Fimbriiglobus sp.]|jgi:hypothetical protein